jgi:putative endonuclease
MYYVYIIYSKKLNKRYIGSTDDLKERLKRHNSGRSKYTSRSNDWVLVYYEAFILKPDAKREELFLKSGKGRERLKYLFNSKY